MYDELCIERITVNSESAISWFMMSSYAYYIEDNPILSDACYDKLAEFILEHYDTLTHEHKKFITKEDLRTGSLYALKDYPLRVISAVNHLRKTKGKKTIEIPTENDYNNNLESFFE